MNALFSALAAAAFAANIPPSETLAPVTPAPVIAIGSINPTTTLLVAPSTGQIVLAFEMNGMLLIPNRSPALAVPLLDANARPAGDVQLLTGLR
jgi:hypothetical protein